MKKVIFIALSLFVVKNSFANHSDHNHQNAPIGVMRDHIHKKGEIMLDYRYEDMSMQGLRDGNKEIDKNDALKKYRMVPTKMKMQMHMFGLMYGLSDDLTIGVMGSYVTKKMDMQNRAGAQTKMEVSDIGDTKINAALRIFEKTHINLGLSIPTGQNDERQGNGSKNMAYGMQNGSGTYDFLPGINFSSHFEKYDFGAQINGVFRLNSNDNGYKFGDQYNFTSWASRALNEKLSLSTRLDYTIFEAIEGNDAKIANSAAMNPIFDNRLSDGQKLYGFVGASYLIGKQRIAIEAGVPLYQRIDGPVLQDKYKITFGLQKVF
jgi:hypothetical protein